MNFSGQGRRAYKDSHNDTISPASIVTAFPDKRTRSTINSTLTIPPRVGSNPAETKTIPSGCRGDPLGRPPLVHPFSGFPIRTRIDDLADTYQPNVLGILNPGDPAGRPYPGSYRTQRADFPHSPVLACNVIIPALNVSLFIHSGLYSFTNIDNHCQFHTPSAR